jgi:hypothetical protein
LLATNPTVRFSAKVALVVVELLLLAYQEVGILLSVEP